MKPQSPNPQQQPPQKPLPKYGPVHDLEDTFGGILDGASKLCLYGGLIAMIIGVVFLLTTYQAFVSNNPSAVAAAGLSNIALLSKVLYVGCVAALVGSTYIWWGEETLAVFQLILGAALWASPFWVPSIMGSSNGAGSEVAGRAVGTIQTGGSIFGGLAIIVLVIDIAMRVRMRAQQGSKADQLKYGKGVKEEADLKNIFMGKCWQLPFCRKFVREACPIYHAKRTCWREKVGCMCEEEVIRKAMTGGNAGTISKDSVAAARFIPVNNRLTIEQKKERCRQCVIYNEHQKHKYKLMLPVTVGGFVLLYVLMRAPLLQMSGGIIDQINKVVGNLTFSGQKTQGASGAMDGSPFFQEMLLVCVLVVILAYALKVLEYLIFKLKV